MTVIRLVCAEYGSVARWENPTRLPSVPRWIAPSRIFFACEAAQTIESMVTKSVAFKGISCVIVALREFGTFVVLLRERGYWWLFLMYLQCGSTIA